MKKITLCLMIILALILIPGAIFAQSVSTQEQFITTIEEGKTVEITKNTNIKLEKDITITNTVTIGAWSGSKATVTIDLNGHTVKMNGSNAHFYVQNAGILIIEDSVGTGLITNAGATSSKNYVIYTKGDCKINGGTVENTLASKEALYIQGETKVATCTLNGGTIKNSYDKSGRAVNVGKGIFTMNGGKVENKAAGDGLVPAIQGGEVVITGGTIESAGTGIKSSNANVKITGGTINAGWFALYTSYATINPAEGKTVNITVSPSKGKAIVLAYNKQKTGEGNEIYGGNFYNCPVLETTGYQASNSTNMKIYGGEFTNEVPAEFVAPGYVVNKVDDKYKVELNTPNFVEEDLKEDKEVEMGVTPEVKEKLEEVFKKEIEENEKIQKALLEGKEVNIHIQMEKVEENVVKEELDKIKETSKDKKIAKIYDITLVVKADETQIDTISETSSKLKFKVLIPEDLMKDNRTFFMYRYHDGEVEEITGEVDEDNYFVFESDRFSTYVLAYEDKVGETNDGGEGTSQPQPDEDEKDEVVEVDKKDEVIEENKKDEVIEEDKKEEIKENKKVETPKTGDNIVLYIVFAVVAIVGIVAVKKNRKK